MSKTLLGTDAALAPVMDHQAAQPDLHQPSTSLRRATKLLVGAGWLALAACQPTYDIADTNSAGMADPDGGVAGADAIDREQAARCVPPSLMLHPRSFDYDLLAELVPWLEENEYQTITYSQYADSLVGGPLPAKPILLTLDDVPGSYRNHYHDFTREMFDLLSADMTMTVGVIVQSPNVLSEVLAYQRDGHELVAHSQSHPNLAQLANSSLSALADETSEAVWNLEQSKVDWADEINSMALQSDEMVEAVPASGFILPYGIPTPAYGSRYRRVAAELTKTDIEFIIGIKEEEQTADGPIYLRRLPLNGDFRRHVETWFLDRQDCLEK